MEKEINPISKCAIVTEKQNAMESLVCRWYNFHYLLWHVCAKPFLLLPSKNLKSLPEFL